MKISFEILKKHPIAMVVLFSIFLWVTNNFVSKAMFIGYAKSIGMASLWLAPSASMPSYSWQWLALMDTSVSYFGIVLAIAVVCAVSFLFFIGLCKKADSIDKVIAHCLASALGLLLVMATLIGSGYFFGKTVGDTRFSEIKICMSNTDVPCPGKIVDNKINRNKGVLLFREKNTFTVTDGHIITTFMIPEDAVLIYTPTGIEITRP